MAERDRPLTLIRSPSRTLSRAASEPPTPSTSPVSRLLDSLCRRAFEVIPVCSCENVGQNASRLDPDWRHQGDRGWYQAAWGVARRGCHLERVLVFGRFEGGRRAVDLERSGRQIRSRVLRYD